MRSTRQAMSMQRLLDDLPRRADGDEASAEELVSSTGMDDSSSRYTRDPAEELERAKAARQVQSDVEQLLEVLPPRQAEAIRAKFGIPAPEGGAGLGPSGRREPHRSDLRQGGDADELDEAFNAMFLGRTDDHADAGGQARRLGNSRRRRDARQGVQLLREMVSVASAVFGCFAKLHGGVLPRLQPFNAITRSCTGPQFAAATGDADGGAGEGRQRLRLTFRC